MSSDTPSSGFPGSSIAVAGDNEGTVGASRDRLAEDVSSLRADMTKMHDILSRSVSEAGGHAARTARNVGHAVSSTASGLATTSAEVASSATEQFKTLVTELEDTARKNPLGTLAGALAVGIVIGLIVRGRG